MLLLAAPIGAFPLARPAAAIQTAVLLPSISPIVTGPGPMFETLMELPPGDDMAHFDYVAEEYLVSGTANGEPYTTRIVVRRPRSLEDASGLVLAESMHPSGNAWMFHFTHRYTMDAGHVGVEILTGGPGTLGEFNPERYGTLEVANGQANDIIAQVGALVRSGSGANPLAGLDVRHVVLAGTSASAGVLIRYLPTHMTVRLENMDPIYDGFLPTSTGATIDPVDVPLIQVPTMTEVAGGNTTTRPDGDESGDQYRSYEFAGMAHVDSRDAAAYTPDPCGLPISRFPLAAFMSVALDHLFAWVDEGRVPPRADRILLDRNTTNDGSLMALDASGNPRGGIRNTYVDLPVKRYGVPNRGADPPNPDAHPFIGSRTPAAQNQLCALAGFEIDLPPARLRDLFGSPANHGRLVGERYDALVGEGWALPVYRDVVMDDAAKVDF